MKYKIGDLVSFINLKYIKTTGIIYYGYNSFPDTAEMKNIIDPSFAEPKYYICDSYNDVSVITESNIKGISELLNYKYSIPGFNILLDQLINGSEIIYYDRWSLCLCFLIVKETDKYDLQILYMVNTHHQNSVIFILTTPMVVIRISPNLINFIQNKHKDLRWNINQLN